MYRTWCRCRGRSRRRRSRCSVANKEDDERERNVAVNRRAFHDYFIDEKYECGIVLTGPEVKSLRAGRCNLRDGFARIDENEAWLENVAVSPAEHGNIMN